MSTNRTKIDWAYIWAKKLVIDKVFHDKQDEIRGIAVALRRAYKRGLTSGVMHKTGA